MTLFYALILIGGVMQCSAHALTVEQLDKQIERKVNALTPPQSSQTIAHKLMSNFLGYDDTDEPSRRIRRGSENLVRARRKSESYNVVYLIDSSNSLGQRNFTIALNALKLLTSKSRPGTRFAAITFADTARISFPFTTRKEAYRQLSKVPFIAGTTNTQEALNLAQRELFGKKNSGATPGAIGRVLIITDGLSNVQRNLTLFNAYKLKMAGPEIYVVAVGQYLYGLHELVGLASSTENHLFRAQSMRGLEGAVRLIPKPSMYRKYYKHRN
ncbi:cuticlin-6 [Nematostella vectensis]|uniref:cuticlin-6 n=1 Tax=Nematostella vectensis TaxID=45351 RepID=UPI001390421E|nr:cuticlin-6 [Nematostella vectensis]